MIGAADIATCMSENGDFDELAGITPRAVSELFRLLNERTAQIDYSVRIKSDTCVAFFCIIMISCCSCIIYS